MTGSIARIAAALLLAASFTACGRDKEIAEKDVKAAEQALAAVQDDGAKMLPDRMKAVNGVIERAKDQLIAGDYRAGMKTAEEALAEAQALPSAIASRKQAMTAEFKAAADSVPGMLAAITARLDSILASKKLPAGVDAGKLAVLKAELPGWKDEWQTATKSYASGDVVAALRKAIELKARALDAMATLKLP